MKKNILFFAQQIYYPWIEWVKNNSIKICEWLNKKIKVNIISHKWENNSLNYNNINWVDVFYLLNLSTNKILQLFYFIIWWFMSLFFVIKNEPQKIFVQYLDTSYLFSLTLISLFKPNIKIILTLYSTDEINISYKKLFLKKIPFEKIIIISELLRQEIINLWYKNEDIIYIPLSYDKLRYLKYWEFSHRNWKKILFSAWPVKEAGSFFMVDFAKIMLGFEFIFAMRKFDEKSENELLLLKKYIANNKVKNIIIKRNINKMEDLLWDVWSLILPLQNINVKMLTPVALLEAMWRWTTCFVSDLLNLEKLVSHNSNAIVFKKNDIYDLKDKFLKNITRKDLWKNAYKFANDYPSFETIVKNYYKLI